MESCQFDVPVLGFPAAVAWIAIGCTKHSDLIGTLRPFEDPGQLFAAAEFSLLPGIAPSILRAP